MKDQNFSIKISDLLTQTGKVDEIVFEGKFLPELKNLTEEGISWNFFIQSLSDTELSADIKDLRCTLDDVCDSCQKKFKRKIDIPEYTANFVLEKRRDKDDDDTDEEFLIDAKNERINIKDMVLQAIVLHDPIVIRCDVCEKKLAESDDDEVPEIEGGWNITFS